MASRVRKEKFLLCPGDGQWEVWGMGPDSISKLVRTCPTPADAKIPAHAILALPLRHVFALPLWLVAGDDATLADMIYLQLEKRALLARSRSETVMHHQVVGVEDAKKLALVAVLPVGLPESLCLDRITHYDLSARVFPLPKNQFTLWIEGDRLVLAVTRDDHLCYFQALGNREITPLVSQELRCIQMRLETEKILASGRGVTLWGEFSSEAQALVGHALGLAVQCQPRPSPCMPSAPWNLIPHSVAQAQVAHQQRAKRRNILALAAAVYALLIGGLIFQVAKLSFQTAAIKTALAKDASTVAVIRETARRWSALEAAINPEDYPLEQLLRCSRSLPPDGVRFTLFERKGTKLLIMGEAKSAASAFKFAEDLKQSKDLAGYKWQMPQPRLLPNDSSQFQIEGEQPHASID
ncbi:MAG: hypothetical protein HY360_05440 [Verrucomicrobia bacterium]|nr:hypothetical protein [Verrucomicrobiota bacterium]